MEEHPLEYELEMKENPGAFKNPGKS
jgi:hypothetical protein